MQLKKKKQRMLPIKTGQVSPSALQLTNGDTKAWEEKARHPGSREGVDPAFPSSSPASASPSVRCTGDTPSEARAFLSPTRVSPAVLLRCPFWQFPLHAQAPGQSLGWGEKPGVVLEPGTQLPLGPPKGLKGPVCVPSGACLCSLFLA